MTSDPCGRPAALAIPTATSTTVVADRAIDAPQFQPMPQPETATSDRAVPAIATPAAKANLPQTCIVEEDDPRAILEGFDPADYV
ncbi:hypothetical protein [Sphingomonas faeni]|uniref:hypothetical protein n=1 Tax=Sphingomonas faeni TaxID=185950 RepID=UPI0027892267|nr:hypothetical protein [Sphingomonas faeni]MDQ0838893.1 hypothetical protein [Sphingomonas faeni]